MEHALPDPGDFPVAVRAGSPAASAALGERAAGLLRGGETLLLWGPLGAGKTTFAQGLCRGLGIGDEVTSPTFALANRLEGRLVVHHLDCYRLGPDDDLHDVGLDAILDEVESGAAVLLAEWPDPLLPWLRDRIELLATPGADPESRVWRLRGVPELPGPWAALAAGGDG